MSNLTHYPSSKGLVPIAGMAWPHLNNAIAKLEREGEAPDMLAALKSERDSRPPPIGDNHPPEAIKEAPISVITEASAIVQFTPVKARLDDLIGEARNWIDGAAVASQAEADALARLKGMLHTAMGDAEKARVAENKPFDEGKAEVQARYNPLIADTKTMKGSAVLAYDAVNRAITGWLTKRDNERLAEAARMRAQAAEALAAAHASAEAARAPDASLEAQEALEETLTFAKQIERAANRLETARPAAIGASRATTLRTYYEPVMVDDMAALQHYWRTRRDDIKAFALTLAKQDVAAGKRQIPGFEIVEEKKVV